MSNAPNQSACAARRRDHLLHRIRRSYEIVTRDIRIGELTIPFTQVRNPDSVLDDIVKEADRRERVSGVKQPDDELHLPYWAELWDSALGVGEWLLARSAIQTPRSESAPGTKRSVLDLGCGMGLAGTVAAAIGHRVLLADIEPPALLFAQLNAMQFDPQVRARRLDWRRDALDERFDLILGADVLYDKSHWPALEPFWRSHLSPRGEVILGEPGRQSGEMFMTWLESRGGWSIERSEVTVSTREKPIRLLRLQRIE